MIRKATIKVAPRPAVIRERYAGFLEEQARFIEKYQRRYFSGMKERFALCSDRKAQSPAN